MQASQSPQSITITGRSQTKMQESLDALRKEYPNVAYASIEMDLSSQKSVRAAAEQVLKSDKAMDILVNNAGVMLIPERQLSEDGIEMHFATNHIGHFLFTNLIVPKLSKSARIVNLSSSSPTQAGVRFTDINFDKVNSTLPEEEQPQYEPLKHWGVTEPEQKSYIPREAYNQSKVSNLLFSIGLNKHFQQRGITAFAVNPGVIQTELQRHMPPEMFAGLQNAVKNGLFKVKTQAAGAATTLVAATDPALGAPEAKDGKENYGVYLSDCQITTGALAKAESNEDAARLWELSERLVGQSFA
jgi:NAD(P)-dependent dehydrogenase (short-subunit alcohol dehydrogenase family)